MSYSHWQITRDLKEQLPNQLEATVHRRRKGVKRGKTQVRVATSGFGLAKNNTLNRILEFLI